MSACCGLAISDGVHTGSGAWSSIGSLRDVPSHTGSKVLRPSAGMVVEQEESSRHCSMSVEGAVEAGKWLGKAWVVADHKRNT